MKKVLAILVSVLMIACILPVGSFADTTTTAVINCDGKIIATQAMIIIGYTAEGDNIVLGNGNYIAEGDEDGYAVLLDEPVLVKSGETIAVVGGTVTAVTVDTATGETLCWEAPETPSATISITEAIRVIVEVLETVLQMAAAIAS